MKVSEQVDKWVEEDGLQGGLVVVRTKDPWYGMSEEEVEDRKEFIRCYLNRDFAVLFFIPVQPRENDFWASSYQEFIESAFNTYDFQRDQQPFNNYAYRIRKILEQVKDLGILHSCISQPESRANIQRHYENLVDDEFRARLLSLAARYQTAAGEEERYLLRQKIAELNRRIRQCQKIWEKYAWWE